MRRTRRCCLLRGLHDARGRRRRSFAPLDAEGEAAFAADMQEVGASLAQGLGLRNKLYREAQLANVRAPPDSSRTARCLSTRSANPPSVAV